MFKWLKKINRWVDGWFCLPRKSEPSDCFAFSDDDEKAEQYGEIQDHKRNIQSTNPFLKLFMLVWLAGISWFVVLIVKCLLAD